MNRNYVSSDKDTTLSLQLYISQPYTVELSIFLEKELFLTVEGKSVAQVPLFFMEATNKVSRTIDFSIQ